MSSLEAESDYERFFFDFLTKEEFRSWWTYRYELLALSRINVLDDAATDEISGYMINLKISSAP